MIDEIRYSRSPRLPVVTASEGAECGLACVAMVANFHGHDIDLIHLRQRFSISLAGSTLRSLISVFDQLGLSARAVRAELSGLQYLTLPAVIHWDLNHFVVLASLSSRGAVIHDPAVGARTISLLELSNRFTGVALEISPSADFTPQTARTKTKLSDLWTGVYGVTRSAGQVLGLSILLQAMVLLAPLQLQVVLDQGLRIGNDDLIATVAIAFAALVAISATLEFARSWMLLVLSQQFSLQILNNLVRHLFRLSPDFFEKRHVGDIMSRLGSGVAIQEILTRGLLSIMIDGAMSIVAVVVMLFYSPTLTGVVVGFVAIYLIVSIILFPLQRRANEERLNFSATEQSYLMESVRAATTIRLMGIGADRAGGWRNRYTKVVNASIQGGRIGLIATTAQALTAGLQTVVVVYLGARSIMQGDGFTAGMLIAFLAYRQIFTDRASNIIGQFVSIRLIGLHLERLSDLVHGRVEAVTDMGLEAPFAGGVQLRDVSFRYGEADRSVLENISLDVKPGEFVAITGPSGGGKSTVVKLLLGIHEPTEGSVRVDGSQLKPHSLGAWRREVGYVAQDDRLISGTIAENISFFDPDLDMQKVHGAALGAYIHEEIMRMPMQYLSLVGDMGSALSGGQKQRILLARAIYRNPKILILDEGTANLDAETEALIVRVVKAFPSTRIVVAHRPALLEAADVVYCLRDGNLHRMHRSELRLGEIMA